MNQRPIDGKMIHIAIHGTMVALSVSGLANYV